MEQRIHKGLRIGPAPVNQKQAKPREETLSAATARSHSLNADDVNGTWIIRFHELHQAKNQKRTPDLFTIWVNQPYQLVFVMKDDPSNPHRHRERMLAEVPTVFRYQDDLREVRVTPHVYPAKIDYKPVWFEEGRVGMSEIDHAIMVDRGTKENAGLHVRLTASQVLTITFDPDAADTRDNTTVLTPPAALGDPYTLPGTPRTVNIPRSPSSWEIDSLGTNADFAVYRINSQDTADRIRLEAADVKGQDKNPVSRIVLETPATVGNYDFQIEVN